MDNATMDFKTLDQVIRSFAAQTPNRVAMTAGDRDWTYSQLHRESAQIAQALLADGVKPQERVAVLDRNVPEYMTFMFGASMINAVTVPVNWRLAPPEMEYIINHAQAQVLLIGEEFLGHLATMNLESVKRVVVVGRSDEYLDYASWIANREPVDPELSAESDDTCCQFYTSGTTGRPKGVELTHSNILITMVVCAGLWSIDSDSVNLVVMPMFHTAGSAWALCGFCQGAHIVIVYEFDPAGVLREMEARKVTHALFVPAVLQVLSASPEAETTDFSAFQVMAYGASPISEKVLTRSMIVFNCDFVQVYGLTETTGAITALSAADHQPGDTQSHLLRAAGRTVGDVQIRLVNTQTGADVIDGEVGEIWCKSAQNMKGYWRNPEATAEAYPEGRDERGIGWFRTGDAGYMAGGYLYIQDRVKDMILSGGENIYPAEVENALMSHPDVADVAVIGVPSEKWGETVKAIVVDSPIKIASDQELLAHCRSLLATYKCPTSIDRLAALPRNPSGKILKTELREPYWKEQARRVS